MKIVLTKLLTSAFALIIFSSCEKEVDNIRYPEFKQKLVISGYISPGKTRNYISVTSNHRIYGELWTNNETWGNLTATLSNDTHEISLDRTLFGFVFNSSDFPIEEGKTYKLKVKSDIGLYAEASCSVPFKRNFALEMDTFRLINASTFNYDSSFMSDFYFTDIQGEDNYYKLLCEQIDYNSNYFISPFVNIISGPENEYFNDKGRDGKRYKITLKDFIVRKDSDSSFLKVFLLHTDKVYYDYHKSLGNYNSGKDPFTEPSPVYSNIIGGLGIFAAYTIDSLLVRLK